MSRVMMILVKDGLQQPSGAVAEAPYSQLIYCRVPDGWVEGEIPDDSNELWIKGPSLSSAGMESVLETLYGATWRGGNSDGSQYVVLGTGSRVLNPRREDEKPWLQDDPSNPTLRFLHYVVGEDGQFQRVPPSGL